MRRSSDASSLVGWRWRSPSSPFSLIIFLLVFSFTLVVLLPAPATAQSNNGCYQYCCNPCTCYNCGYCCGYYCCSCPYGCCCGYCVYFQPIVSSAAYYSGCTAAAWGASRTIYIQASTYAQIYDGAQTAVYLQATSSTIYMYNPASVSNVYVQASSTNTWVQSGASIGTVNGGSYSQTIQTYGVIGTAYSGGGSSYIYNTGSMTTLSMASGGAYIYGSASYVTMSSNTGVVTVYGGATVGTLYGCGTFDIYGSVTAISTTCSNANVYLRSGSSVSRLYLGGTTYVNSNGISVSSITVVASGSTMTMTGSGNGFGSLTQTAAVSSFGFTGVSTSIGCMVFQQPASGVSFNFQGSSFSSSSCHMLEFQSTVASSTLVVWGSSATSVNNYAIVKAGGWVNGLYVYYDYSRLTVSGYEAFNFNTLSTAGATITFNNMYTCVTCGGPFNDVSVTALLTITNGGIAASTLSVLSTTANLYATNHIVRSGGAMYSVLLSATGGTWYTSSNIVHYFASTLTTAVVTNNGNSFYSDGGDILRVGGILTSLTVRITNNGRWVTTCGGCCGLSTYSTSSNIDFLIKDDKSRISTKGPNFYASSGLMSNIVVTVTQNAGTSDNTWIEATAESNFHLEGGASNLKISLIGTLMSGTGNNIYCNGGSQQITMYVVSSTGGSSATVTSSGDANWKFSSAASLTNANSLVSISGGSLMRSQTSDNFQFLASASIAISVIGTATQPSFMYSVAQRNLYVAGDAQYLNINVVQSTITSTWQNFLVGGQVGNVYAPNPVYLTSSTISCPSGYASVEIQAAQRQLTITALSSAWTFGGSGAISLAGAATTSGLISISLCTLSLSTSFSAPAVVQLHSGTAATMQSQVISIVTSPFTYTSVGAFPATVYPCFIRTLDTVMSGATVSVYGSSFTVVSTAAQRMEILVMDGGTRITSSNVVLTRIPYTSSTSCSTLPKGYVACDALARGAIVMSSASGSIVGSTITVQCIEFSTTSLAFIDLQGVITGTFVRTDSVAIWQSQAVVAFINLANAGSSANSVRMLYTYIHVPVIVHSAAGAGGASGGIAADCSYISQYPMSDGFFESALVALVTRLPLPLCPKQFVPTCWITKSGSVSVSSSVSLSNSLSTSDSLTLSNEISETVTRTISLSVSQEWTGTVSLSSQRSESATLAPSASRRLSGSRSLRETASTTVNMATLTLDRRARVSRTASGSASQGPTWTYSRRTRTPSLSQAVSFTRSQSLTQTNSTTLSWGTTSLSNTTAGSLSLTPTGATPSELLSATASESASASLSGSIGTPSFSQQRSKTRSATASASVSDSAETPTAARSRSRSGSESATEVESRSASLTRSVTPEASRSDTLSASATPSNSTTTSNSSTLSASRSTSRSGATPTREVSTSVSESQQVSFTRSVSASLSQAVTPSMATHSESQALSKTASESVSTLLSVTRTIGTPTGSNSTTVSVSLSETVSPSVSVGTGTPEPSATHTGSSTTTVTVSDSATPSGRSHTSEASPSVSSTPGPTLEVTLSVTETFSVTPSVSMTRLSVTRRRSRSRTRFTASSQATPDWSRSRSVSAPRATLTRSAPSGTGTSTGTASLPASGTRRLSATSSRSAHSGSGEATASESGGASSTASATRHRVSPSGVRTPSDSTSSTVTATEMVTDSRATASATSVQTGSASLTAGRGSHSRSPTPSTSVLRGAAARGRGGLSATVTTAWSATTTKTAAASLSASGSTSPASATLDLRHPLQPSNNDSQPAANRTVTMWRRTLTRSASGTCATASVNRRLSATAQRKTATRPRRGSRTATTTLTVISHGMVNGASDGSGAQAASAPPPNRRRTRTHTRGSGSVLASSTATETRGGSSSSVSRSRLSVTLSRRRTVSLRRRTADASRSDSLTSTWSVTVTYAMSVSFSGGRTWTAAATATEPAKATHTAAATGTPSQRSGSAVWSASHSLLVSATASKHAVDGSPTRSIAISRLTMTETRPRARHLVGSRSGTVNLTGTDSRSMAVTNTMLAFLNGGGVDGAAGRWHPKSSSATWTRTLGVSPSVSVALPHTVTKTVLIVTGTPSRLASPSSPLSLTLSMTDALSWTPTTTEADSLSGSLAASTSVAAATVTATSSVSASASRASSRTAVMTVTSDATATASSVVTASVAAGGAAAPPPQAIPLNSSNAFGQLGLSGSSAWITGGAPSGMAAGLLVVNAAILGLALVSSLLFAVGLRGRRRRRDREQADAQDGVLRSPSTATAAPTTGEEDGAPLAPPSLLWRAVSFHVYASVLLPCSATCGWTHAGASCLHANVTMLVAVVLARYMQVLAGLDAWLHGLLVPCLVLIMHVVVQRLALPCVTEISPLPAGAERGREYLADDKPPLSPRGPLAKTVDGTSMRPHNRPPSSQTQKSIQSLEDLDLRDALSSNSKGDAKSYPFAGKRVSGDDGTLELDEDDIDVLDLDAMATFPLEPRQPRLVKGAADDYTLDVDIDVDGLFSEASRSSVPAADRSNMLFDFEDPMPQEQRGGAEWFRGGEFGSVPKPQQAQGFYSDTIDFAFDDNGDVVEMVDGDAAAGDAWFGAQVLLDEDDPEVDRHFRSATSGRNKKAKTSTADADQWHVNLFMTAKDVKKQRSAGGPVKPREALSALPSSSASVTESTSEGSEEEGEGGRPFWTFPRRATLCLFTLTAFVIGALLLVVQSYPPATTDMITSAFVVDCVVVQCVYCALRAWWWTRSDAEGQ